MPQGKPAGVPCVQLDEQLRCRIFGDPARPAVCGGLQPGPEMCGPDTGHAMRWLSWMEVATQPGRPQGRADSVEDQAGGDTDLAR